MPIVINSWQANITSGPQNPTDFSVSAGSNRLLTVFTLWNDIDLADVTTPSLTYGGQTMTREAIGRMSQFAGGYWAGGAALFTLNETGISAATSNAFELSWTSALPEHVAHYKQAFENVASLAAKVKESGVNNYVLSLTTSHSRVSGSHLITAATTVGSCAITWNVNNLNTVNRISGLTHSTFSLAFKVITSDSGSENVISEFSRYSLSDQISALLFDAPDIGGSIAADGIAASLYDAFASTELSDLDQGISAEDSFFPIQEGDSNQFINQFFYKQQVVYAADMNRLADNIRLVHTTEVSSAEPINKTEGSFWLDISNPSSYQMRITTPGDQLIAAFAIDPNTHKPDFSGALGGNQFQEYSITTNKFGSGQLTSPDFADGAFTKEKIGLASQSRFAAHAIGSGTLAQNTIGKTHVLSGSLYAEHFDLQTASVSGTSTNVTIQLNKFSLMPDFRSSSTNMRMAGHTGTSNRDTPRVRLDGGGSSYSYDVAWYYVDET